MRQQITRLSPLQTAKVMAAMYGLMSVIFIPIVYFGMARGSSSWIPGGMLIVAPLVYAAFGFVFVAIGCLLYNFVASFTGGIEVDLQPSEHGMTHPIA